MDKCPCCERKFSGISDFPLAKIIKFTRIPLPKIVCSAKHIEFDDDEPLTDKSVFPKEVLKEFRGIFEGCVSYQGKVYIREVVSAERGLLKIGEDVTEIVKEAVNTPNVRNTLSALENFVGKEIKTQGLLNMLKFEVSGEKFELKIYENEFERAHFAEIERGGVIVLTSNYTGDVIHGSVYRIFQTLAQFRYQGIVNNPSALKKAENVENRYNRRKRLR